MSVSYAAIGWTENGLRRSLDRSHPEIMGYMASPPILESETTGIRALLDASSNGSGSKYGAVIDSLSELKERLISVDVSGSRIMLSIATGVETEAISPPTIPEKLDQIRDVFGLSMSALSVVLQSCRASVYNWYIAAPRREDNLQRIETLYKIARQWRAMNPFHYAPGKLMKQKLGDGPSMLERLGRETLDSTEIQAGLKNLLALMQKQRTKMDRAKARSENVPVDDESHKELLERLTGSVTADK